MSKEELHGTITARAELDRAFARLLVEDATEVMSKNLVSLLQVIENNHNELKVLMEDNGARWGKAIGVIVDRLDKKRVELDDIQSWRRMTDARLAALEARDDDR